VTPSTAGGSRPVTIVMYHFVRPAPFGGLSKFAALDVSAFREQLRYVKRYYSPIRLADVVSAANDGQALPPRPIVLTFDDGYRDHVDNVFPLLVDHGIPATFFPVRAALVDRRVLDTNKVHFILAAAPDPATIVSAIDRAIENSRETTGGTVEAYRARWWAPSRFDGPDIVYVKRMLQHGLPDEIRRPLVASLFQQYVTSDEAAFAAGLYLTVTDARMMLAAGMEFGGHGDRHIPLPALGAEDQAREIDGAVDLLRAIGVTAGPFAYSYVKGEYDATSVKLLRSRGCAIAVTTREDLARPGIDDVLTLPRIDTNRLPTDGDAPANDWTTRALP